MTSARKAKGGRDLDVLLDKTRFPDAFNSALASIPELVRLKLDLLGCTISYMPRRCRLIILLSDRALRAAVGMDHVKVRWDVNAFALDPETHISPWAVVLDEIAENNRKILGS